MLHSMDEYNVLCSVVNRHGQTHVHCHCWCFLLILVLFLESSYLFFIDVVSLSMWFEYEFVLSINTRESCRKSAFYAVKGSKTQDLPSSDVYLAWKNLCKKYEWSNDQEKTREVHIRRKHARTEAQKMKQSQVKTSRIKVLKWICLQQVPRRKKMRIF